MVELNPLHQDILILGCNSSSNTNDEVCNSNRKGRPRKENVIRFGPQPQSMISKLLNNTKSLPNNDDNFHGDRKQAVCIVQIPSAPNHSQSVNKKGRPLKSNVTQFSQQPQSMVSKSLSKLKGDCVVAPSIEKHDSETISRPSTPICKVESGPTDTDVYPQKPKRRKKTKKVKVPGKPKTYSCEFENCSYFTKLASNMTKHKRVHSGEKPYLCDRCSFRSSFINSLKSHKRLHTEVRPYKCSECSYSCNSISNLKKHCYTKHKNLPDSP